MILFLNTVFLGIYLISLLLDMIIYEDYKRADIILPKKNRDS